MVDVAEMVPPAEHPVASNLNGPPPSKKSELFSDAKKEDIEVIRV